MDIRLNEIKKGILAYTEAIQKFNKFDLQKYFLLVFLLLFIFLFPVMIMDAFMYLFSFILPFSKSTKYESLFAQFMASISGFFLLLVLSPVFSLVSEKVTAKLQGKTYHFSSTQFIKDILRGIKITLRNLIYEYLFIALISILLYLSPKNSISNIMGNILLILVTSYYYGFTLLDYALENHRFSYKKSLNFVKNNKGIAIGLGLVYHIIISTNDLPFVENILGHFTIYITTFGEAIIVFIGVIAASILVSRKLKNPK